MGLSIFNSIAVAAAAPAGGGGSFSFLIIIVVMFVAMYFMLIRPQQKKQKQHRAMIDALSVGDEVITNGGIGGRVVKLSEGTFVTVEIAPDVQIKLQRASIAQVLVTGTLKSA
ncbi:MAG TPA: preprotein translocase subunit YajC [Oleiagrimonas sp.]|nr:preprotein translocase subunit YajC [Oleiagrimonas sp.]